MKWIFNAERKWGRFAIPNLMKYMMGIMVLGSVMGLINPNIYYDYLSFNVDEILHGQVWRIVTFLLYPSISSGSGLLSSVLFFAIFIYLYYFIGNTLEQVWGSFRFNLYFFSGVFMTIVVSFLYVVVSKDYMSGIYSMTLDDVYQAMFLTFAMLFPEQQFLLFFVVPIKAKWLALAYGTLTVYGAMMNFMSGNYFACLITVVALLNFVLFYMLSRKISARPTFSQRAKATKRRVRYQNSAESATQSGPRHKCVICGRTELDAPHLDFRYCSKCEGNYEYCSEHLFSHEHVHKH